MNESSLSNNNQIEHVDIEAVEHSSKFKRYLLLSIFFLICLLLGLSFAVINNLTQNVNKKIEETKNIVQVKESEVFKKVQIYLNPFSTTSHYLNPFAQIDNPFLVFNEDPSDFVQFGKYNIVFPIQELGDCSNLSACIDYCSHATNYTSCSKYASLKKVIFDLDSEGLSKMLDRASKELTCKTMSACISVCSARENINKCTDFAHANGLNGGLNAVLESKSILDKAESILGCNSLQACERICNDSANRQKCSDFAKRIKIKGGFYTYGPGGCTADEECRLYCSENKKLCKDFEKSHGN